MTDKQIIEYKHIKCTRDDCCHYCGSVFCGYVDDIENLEKAYKAKEQECERLTQGYAELTDIVSPYMDDFTGYNEELGGFDIMLCVKELMEQLDQLKAENEELKQQFKIADPLYQACNIKDKKINQLKIELEVEKNWHKIADEISKANSEYTAKLKQAIEKIKEIAEEKANVNDWLALQTLQICDEVNE